MKMPDSKIEEKLTKLQQLLISGEKERSLQLVNELLVADKQTASSYLLTTWAQLQLGGDNAVSIGTIHSALAAAIMLDPYNVRARIELSKYSYTAFADTPYALECLSEARGMINALEKQISELENKYRLNQ